MIRAYKFSAFAEKNKPLIRASLVSPWVDAYLLGGLSLLLLICVRFFHWHLEMSSPIWWALIYLTSFPHFLSSYVLFYGNSAQRVSHPLIGYVFPIVIAITLAAGVLLSPRTLIVMVARVAYAWLFWHLAKQAYGACVWMGGAELRGAKSNSQVRTSLRWLCHLVALYGYVAAQMGAAPVIAFGIYTPSLALGDSVFSVCYLLAGFSLAGFGVYCLMQKVSILTLLPVLALFTWLQPDAFRNGTFLLVPIFHGLQYFPFFHSRWTETQPTRFFGSSFLCWIAMAGLGMFVFLVFPRFLAENLDFTSPERIGPAVMLFFNLHHFLIDSVLWKFARGRSGLAGK